jgi:hypothetical protein
MNVSIITKYNYIDITGKKRGFKSSAPLNVAPRNNRDARIMSLSLFYFNLLPEICQNFVGAVLRF